jgi:CheY-like chemotaxis protein
MDTRQPILLVDDSENDILLLRRAFKKAEFNSPLQEVHNGEEAIAYLKGDGVYADRNLHPLPSFILLDLNMPMKNGFDVLAWAREQPALKPIAITVLTASMRQGDVERAFNLGASSYLVKPGNLESFAAMLRCLRDWIEINHLPPLNSMVAK